MTKYMSRQRLRHLVLWVMAADAPVLYLSATTLESAAATIVALAVMAAAAAVAAVVY